MLNNISDISSGLYANTSLSPQNILEYVPQHFQDACQNFHMDIIQTMASSYKAYIITLVILLTITILIKELSFLYNNNKIYIFYFAHILPKIDLFMIILAWIIFIMIFAY